MYLMFDLVNSEYLKFNDDILPPCIIAYYKIDGYIYVMINKAWYQLRQS